jgi:hypothetical protein
MTKISITEEELKALGYHLSYPQLLEKTKHGEPLLSILEDQKKLKEEEQKEKLSKIKKKRPIEEEYDLEDPFIDDTEVIAQYESIFQVLEEEEDQLAVQEGEGEEKKVKRLVNPDNLNFYVYRGPLEVDYIEK